MGSSVVKNAGAAGTFTVTTSVTPTAAPTLTIYSNAARTIVAHATQTLAGSGVTWTAVFPAALPAGTYYLTTSYATGFGTATDSDDTLILLPATAEVGVGIVTLDQAKTHLKNAGTTAPDEQLRLWIPAVTPVIEHITGPVVPRSVTADVTSSGDVLILPDNHVVSVTSVTEWESGVSQAVSLHDPTLAAPTYGYTRSGSLLHRLASGYPSRWNGTVRVIYTAGMAPIPEAIQLAALMILEANWRPSQLGLLSEIGDAIGNGQSMSDPWLIPHTAKQLLAAYKRGPMVA